MGTLKEEVIEILTAFAEMIQKEPEPDWREVWSWVSEFERRWVINHENSIPVKLYMDAKWSESEGVGKIRAYIFCTRSFMFWDPPEEWELFTEVVCRDTYPEVIVVAQSMWAGACDKFVDMTVPTEAEKAPESQNTAI